VVQIVESFGESMEPTFVERLAAVEIAEELGLPIPPVMIYGDDVTHVITENGIANLLLCRSPEEREQAIRGVAGYTEVGRQRDRSVFRQLRERGVVRLPEDLEIDPLDADRTMLAAGSIRDLVRSSGGLYRPPARFRNY
jgi:malonate decarboxylase alpha subunit